jgi:hypothetical protein
MPVRRTISAPNPAGGHLKPNRENIASLKKGHLGTVYGSVAEINRRQRHEVLQIKHPTEFRTAAQSGRERFPSSPPAARPVVDCGG